MEKDNKVMMVLIIILLLLLLFKGGDLFSSVGTNSTQTTQTTQTQANQANQNQNTQVQTTPTQTSTVCVDNDNGINPDIQGSCTDSIGTGIDYCDTEGYLQEWECNTNSCRKIKAQCPTGKVCSGGTCVIPPYVCCQSGDTSTCSTSCPAGAIQTLGPFTYYSQCRDNCLMPLMIGGYACIDSDMSNVNPLGRDIYRVGSCRGGGGELDPYTDKCFSSTKLTEYSCGTGATASICLQETINCPNGCNAGICS